MKALRVNHERPTLENVCGQLPRLWHHSGTPQTVAGTMRVWTPAGKEISFAGPLTGTLAPGEVKTCTLDETSPGTAPAGDYQVIGRVENAAFVFDEDAVVYDVR